MTSVTLSNAPNFYSVEDDPGTYGLEELANLLKTMVDNGLRRLNQAV